MIVVNKKNTMESCIEPNRKSNTNIKSIIMKKITVLFLLISVNLVAQKKFSYDSEGLKPRYVVIEVDSLDRRQLYKKAVDWIKELHKDPNKVIKSKDKEKKFTITAFKSKVFRSKIKGRPFVHDARYTVEISFRSGRYKFEPIGLEYYTSETKYSSSRWNPISLDRDVTLYSRSNKINDDFKSFPSTIAEIFNGVNSDIIKFIKRKNKDEW